MLVWVPVDLPPESPGPVQLRQASKAQRSRTEVFMVLNRNKISMEEEKARARARYAEWIREHLAELGPEKDLIDLHYEALEQIRDITLRALFVQRLRYWIKEHREVDRRRFGRTAPRATEVRGDVAWAQRMVKRQDQGPSRDFCDGTPECNLAALHQVIAEAQAMSNQGVATEAIMADAGGYVMTANLSGSSSFPCIGATASYLWIGQVQTCCRFVRGWIAYDPVGNTTDVIEYQRKQNLRNLRLHATVKQFNRVWKEGTKRLDDIIEDLEGQPSEEAQANDEFGKPTTWSFKPETKTAEWLQEELTAIELWARREDLPKGRPLEFNLELTKDFFWRHPMKCGKTVLASDATCQCKKKVKTMGSMMSAEEENIGRTSGQMSEAESSHIDFLLECFVPSAVSQLRSETAINRLSCLQLEDRMALTLERNFISLASAYARVLQSVPVLKVLTLMGIFRGGRHGRLAELVASFLVEPLTLPTRVPPILLEPLPVAVPSERLLLPPLPAANELVQLWYAVQAARRLNATRRQMLLEMWRRVAGFENAEGALLLQLGVL
ncbi:unnamed protein product [Symbiodinium necroappetens]|uniref:Uncharacterized protein n=1 Tax=Symbiodinium necroappetens TaxID=1628268 RepID=A0A812TY67_9DINO|nr:unnamed protein product [Symbiodinium necroappetens]